MCVDGAGLCLTFTAGLWSESLSAPALGGLCFVGFTANNILVILDKTVFPNVDLATPRLVVGLIAMLVLLYGLIWNVK